VSVLVISGVAAFVACFGYGIGSVLQSVGARRTAHVAGVSGVALILLQLPYLLGLVADGLAFVANIVALHQLPLFLVQSIMTASVGVTAIIASIRGERLSWPNWLSLAVLGAGLVILCLSANPESAVRVTTTAQWVILAATVLPVVVGLAGLRLPNRSSALVLAGAAGLAWTGVAVASRGLSAEPVGWALLGVPLLWTIVLQGVIGAVFFALGLQRGSVTAVTAITFVLEMVIPSGLGLWLFGDAVGPGLAPWAVAGFALAIGGTVSLMRFAAA
jgi:drug/metabolite transporter (DMT)-like permease